MDEKSDFSSKKYYVYILYSLKDTKLYIGFTNNLKNRLSDHASEKVEATKNRTPLKLIHYEYFIHRKDAEAREKFLKSGYGRKQFKEILKNTLNDLY
jgi:putative endonuclease